MVDIYIKKADFRGGILLGLGIEQAVRRVC